MGCEACCTERGTHLFDFFIVSVSHEVEFVELQVESLCDLLFKLADRHRLAHRDFDIVTQSFNIIGEIVNTNCDLFSFQSELLLPLESVKLGSVLTFFTEEHFTMFDTFAGFRDQFWPTPFHIVEFGTYGAIVAVFVSQKDDQVCGRD